MSSPGVGLIDPELRAAIGLIARTPRLLVALPQTMVAVVSGRALRDLATLSRLPSEVHLVGPRAGPPVRPR